jgi:glutamyl-tRNA reductase
VAVVGLEDLRDAGSPGLPGALAHDEHVAAVRQIVADEFAAHVSAGRAARVAPTVVALRAKAAEVVDAELARLASRLVDLDPRSRDEIARALHRVVDKLLHAPTVRVKELAGSPGADSYEAALRVLFDLDPATVAAVASADAGLAPRPGRRVPRDRRRATAGYPQEPDGHRPVRAGRPDDHRPHRPGRRARRHHHVR